MPAVILVTGGTGLVGKAIEHVINTEPENSRFGKKTGETWVFASSKEGDLRWAVVYYEGRAVLIGWDAAAVRDPEQTRKLFEKYKPTHVIHLAALGRFASRKLGSRVLINPFTSRRFVQEHEIQGTSPSLPISRPIIIYHILTHVPQLTFLRDNILINDNILQTTYLTSNPQTPTKLISCLSTCVFPDKVAYPLDETKIHSGPPHESNFGYAHAKRLVDVQNQWVSLLLV